MSRASWKHGSLRKYFAEPGQRFGRLIVIRETRIQRGGRWLWAAECVCDCGSRTTVLLTDLHRGQRPRQPGQRLMGTRSCGCLQREASRSPIEQTVDPAEEFECATIAAQYTGREAPVETADVIAARNADLPSLRPPVPRPPRHPVRYRTESLDDQLTRHALMREAQPEDGVL